MRRIAIIVVGMAVIGSPRSAGAQAAFTSAADALGIGVGAGGVSGTVTSGGAGGVSIGISAPSGRGVSPQVAIQFRGGTFSANGGVVGQAWELDLGTIHRTGPRDGPPAYGATDVYSMSLGGAGASRLVYVAADGFYHTEAESFAKIEHIVAGGRDYWQMHDLSGRLYVFGYGYASATDSQTTDGTRIARWHLDRVVDLNGNYLTIAYVKDGNQLYPSEIRYTGKTVPSTDPTFNPATLAPASIGATGARQVLFTYAAATTVAGAGPGATSLSLGFPVVTRNLLTDVTVKLAGNQLRRYHLGFQTAAATGLPLLQSWQIFGADNTSSLPATVYTYGNASPPASAWSATAATAYRTVPVAEVLYGRCDSSGDPLRLHSNDIKFVDLDGDGFTDYVWNRGGFQASSGAYRNKGVDASGNPLGYEAVPGFVNAMPTMLYGSFNFLDNRTDTLVKDQGVELADMNGDSYPDVVQSYAYGPETTGGCAGDTAGGGGTSMILLNKVGTGTCNPYGTSFADSCWAGGAWASLPTVMTTCTRSVVTCDPACATSCSGIDCQGICPGDGCGRCETVTTESYPCVDAFAAGTCLFNYQTRDANYDMGCRLADLNGDGLPDLVKGLQTSTGELQLKAWLNSGDPTNLWIPADAVYAPPKPFVRWVKEYENRKDWVAMDLGWRLVDVNGDGLVDLVRAYLDNTNGSQAAVDAECKTASPGGTCVAVVLNNGATVGWDAHYLSGNDAVYQAYSPRPAVGVNGFVVSGSRPLRSIAQGWQFQDVNGDGLPDLVRAYRDSTGQFLAAYVNDLDKVGWTSAPGYSLPLATTHAFCQYVSGNEGVAFADVNGDGSADIVQSNTSDQYTGHNDTAGCTLSGTTCTKRNTWLGTVKSPSLITQIQSPLGGKQTFTYTPSTRFVQRHLPQVMQLVTQMTVNAGTADPAITTSFRYLGGYLYSTAARVEFRGFREVDQIDSAGMTQATWRYTVVPGDATTGISEALKGATQSNETVWPDGTIARYATFTYFSDADGVAPWFAPPRETREFGCDRAPTSSCAWFSHEIRQYDARGNPQEVVETGDDGLARTEWTSWQVDTTKWILARPLSVRLYSGVKAADDAGAGLEREKLMSYDARGRLSQERLRLAGTTYGSSTTSYDDYGNVTSVTDARGHATTTRYDLTPCLDFSLPEKITNAKGFATTTVHDCRGQVMGTTDMNGQSTTYTYDTFGRQSAVIAPGDSPASASMQFQYVNIGSPTTQYTKAIVKDGSADGRWTLTYRDGLGRITQTQTEAQGGTIYGTVRYDALGRKSFESIPAFGAPSPIGTSYGYDLLGRETSIARPGLPARTLTYDRRTTLITDEGGWRTRLTGDSFARVIRTEAEWPTAGSFLETKTAYDARGDVVEIIDPVAADRTFRCPTLSPNHSCLAYDFAGRRVSADDPDTGHWTYTYDAGGNLLSETDAKGQKVSKTYDELNRVTVTDLPPVGPGVEDIVTYYDGALPASCYSCDDHDTTTADLCDASTLTCRHVLSGGSVCGNGVVEAGEQCDGGACCTATCTFKLSGTVCRTSAGPCDVAESCTGASAACPSDGFAPAATICRAAASACDVAEHCSGTSPACPADGFQPNGTPCNDGLFCTATDTCTSGACSGSGSPCVAGQSCNESTDSCVCIPTCSGTTCGAADGCGGTCCAGSGCTAVVCSVCKRANACGSVCSNAPDGTQCTDDGSTCTDDTCTTGLCRHVDNGTCTCHARVCP